MVLRSRPPRLASLLALVLASSACGGSDDAGDSIADEGEAGPGDGDSGESTESGSSGSSSSTATDETDGSSSDGSSSDGSEVDDAMEDPPVEGSPDTHDSIEGSAETIVDDGSDCANSCECPQGLLCTDFGICAPAPDDVWCCANPGCPVGEACVFPDESEGVCR